MSARPTQDVTHDVGERISWTLRPAISTKLNMIVYDDLSKDDLPEGTPLPKVGDQQKTPDGKTRTVTQILTWQERRNRMQDVCSGCHASGQVTGFYRQFDDLVDLYNDKFARPATAIVNELYKANKLTAAPMDEKLEWIYSAENPGILPPALRRGERTEVAAHQPQQHMRQQSSGRSAFHYSAPPDKDAGVGQTRSFGDVGSISALWPHFADSSRTSPYVRDVP